MIVPPSHGSTWLSNSFLVIFSLFFLGGLICICIWTDWSNIYMHAAACWACICLAVNFACGTMAQGVARAKKFCAAIPAAFATANISTLYSGPLSPSSRQVVDALEQPNFATPHNTENRRFDPSISVEFHVLVHHSIAHLMIYPCSIESKSIWL